MDAQLRKMLTDTVHVATVTDRPPEGRPTWSGAIPYPARVERSIRQDDSPRSTTNRATHTICFDTDCTPLLGDRLWLPGADPANAAKAKIIQRVDIAPGLTTNSIDHYECYIRDFGDAVDIQIKHAGTRTFDPARGGTSYNETSTTVSGWRAPIDETEPGTKRSDMIWLATTDDLDAAPGPGDRVVDDVSIIWAVYQVERDPSGALYRLYSRRP